MTQNDCKHDVSLFCPASRHVLSQLKYTYRNRKTGLPTKSGRQRPCERVIAAEAASPSPPRGLSYHSNVMNL